MSIQHEQFDLDCGDHLVAVRRWRDTECPQYRGVITISHGLGEHCARYQWLAENLCAQSWVVYAHDHLGHGETKKRNPGDKPTALDWDEMVADIGRVRQRAVEENPDLPLVHIAHSMGSVLATCDLMRNRPKLDKLVLSGCFYPFSFGNRLVSLMATIENWRTGPATISPWIEAMLGKDLNKGLQPRVTPADWLSRDTRVGEAYHADPECQLSQSNAGWKVVIGGFRATAKQLDQYRDGSELPILMMAGDADPLNEKGRLIEKLQTGLVDAGFSKVSSNVYPGARHELFNETNREEVVQNLIDWLHQ